MDLIKKNKGKIVIIMGIICLLVFSIISINWFYNRSILKSYVRDITVQKIDNNDKSQFVQNGKQEWNLSDNIIEDIDKNPENYRKVIININIHNISKYLYFDSGEFIPKYNETFKNMVIIKFDNVFCPKPFSLETGEARYVNEIFIVKCSNKTDEEIKKLARKTSFTIKGDTYYYHTIGISKNVCESMDKSHK